MYVFRLTAPVTTMFRQNFIKKIHTLVLSTDKLLNITVYAQFWTGVYKQELKITHTATFCIIAIVVILTNLLYTYIVIVSFPPNAIFSFASSFGS